MKRFEKAIFGLLIGAAFPISYFLLSVIIWFYFDRNTDRVIFYIIVGLVLGFITDFKYLKGWINNRYELPVWFISGIYIFYNITLYGIFMGFPVFNVLMGIVAGYYYGNRITMTDIPKDKYAKIVNRVSAFTGAIMTLICIATGFLGLAGNGVGGEVKGMLRLDFEVTRPMLWGITLIGGLLLIVILILITRITMIKTIKSNTQ